TRPRKFPSRAYRAQQPFIAGQRLFDDKGLDFLDESVAAVRVNVQLDRLGEIQAENAHNGFGVDCITPGNQVNVEVIFAHDVDELFHVIDGVEHDVASFHWYRPPLKF